MDGSAHLVPLCSFIGLASGFQGGRLLGGLSFGLVPMRLQQRSGLFGYFQSIQLINPSLVAQIPRWTVDV